MKIIVKNSAKCTHCGEEVESKHRHDFNAHYCLVNPKQAMKREGTGPESKLVPTDGQTFNFAVDGGKAYIRRVGRDYEETSTFTDDEAT